MNGDNGVQLYSNTAKELAYSQQHKVMKLVEHGCIEYDSDSKCYWCNPIIGYNSTRYKIISYNHELKAPECDCQGFQTKFRKWKENPQVNPMPNCSHVGALHEHWKRTNIVKVPQRVSMGMQMVLEVSV
jgi:hypothetical protein